MSTKIAEEHPMPPINTTLLDCEAALNTFFLVKVPRVLAELWESFERETVGDIQVTLDVATMQVSVRYKPDKDLSSEDRLPEFQGSVDQEMLQKMAVIGESTRSEGVQQKMEGFINARVSLLPPDVTSGVFIPKPKPVGDFRPVLLDENFLAKGKVGGTVHTPGLSKRKLPEKKIHPIKERRFRGSRDEVRQKLFAIFEEHQNLSMKQLVDMTDQPAAFVKEIMSDIGIFQDSGPNNKTYKLKPEYCHYFQQIDSV